MEIPEFKGWGCVVVMMFFACVMVWEFGKWICSHIVLRWG